MKRTHHHVILLVVGSLFVVVLVALTSLVLYKNSQALQSQTALLHASEVTSMPINSVVTESGSSGSVTLPSPAQNSNSRQTFSGPITQVDTSCNRDGTCRVQVNGAWIVTNLGGDPNLKMAASRGPKGSIILADGTRTGSIGIDQVGHEVEVSAKRLSNGTYTLYGSSDYYIKFK